MSIFVDTSGFLAVLDSRDKNHRAADRVWKELVASTEQLVTSNYVLVETVAIVQHRFGMEAVQTLARDVFPILSVTWVDADRHNAGMGAVLLSGRRRLSLVDCTSFELMRMHGIQRCLAFDSHFEEQGFHCLP